MRRLAASLVSQSARVEVTLQFLRDEARRPVVKGHIEASLRVMCQRCMRPMDLDLRLNVSLGIVQSEEQAERLPEEMDPLLVDEEPVWIADLIEDELILGLPVVATHPADSPDCHTVQTAGPRIEQAPTRVKGDEGGQENPFAVLSALKKGKSDTD